MSDRLDDIKYWSVINEQTIHPKVSLYKSDFDWLVEQAEKVEQYKKALKWIVENFDSDKSGLSDEEYHKEMIKKANESLKC
jgi:FAD synthase